MAPKKKKTKKTVAKTTKKTATKRSTAKTKKTAVKKATKKVASKKKTKATTKKPAARRAAKTVATPKPVKRELSVRSSGFDKVNKTRTKSQVLSELSTSTGLTRKELGNVFENLATLMSYDLTKGPGTFQIPGLLKVVVVHKPAVPARKGVNPFTGEEMMFKAKPARNVVRARPLKGLKDMVR